MMGPELLIGVGILILLVCLPVVAISRTFARQTLIHRWRRLLGGWREAFSAWSDGTSWLLSPGGLGKGLPALEGRVRERELLLVPREIGDEGLSVALRLPLRRPATGRIEVEPETLGHRIKRFFTGEPQVGNPEFDEAFWIVSSVCEQAVRDVIPDELCEALVHFRKSRNSWICLKIADEEIRFEERGGPLRPHGYPELMAALAALAERIETTGRIYDGTGDFLMEVVAHGGELPEGAICQVCGGPLGLSRVECVACSTPHHPDCWEYNGGCAIFACGSRRCRKVPGS